MEYLYDPRHNNAGDCSLDISQQVDLLLRAAGQKPLKEKEIKMKNSTYEYDAMEMEQMGNGAKHILTGILVGGLIGATAMLFLAPRSGEEMRAEVRDKATELRDRTAETVKDRVSQVKSKAGNLTGNVRGQAEDIKHLGQDMLVEKLDRAAEALEAAKKAIQSL
jgi:gas vesicle protein